MNCFENNLSSPLNLDQPEQPYLKNQILVNCRICDRKFNEEAIVRHTKICEKTALKPKKIFDSKAKRAAAFEALNGPFTATKKQQKNQIKIEESSIKNSKKLENGLFECQGCSRSFNEKAAERHIPQCIEKQKIGPADQQTHLEKINKLALRKKMMKYKPKVFVKTEIDTTPKILPKKLNYESKIKLNLKDETIKKQLKIKPNCPAVKKTSRTNSGRKSAESKESSFDDAQLSDGDMLKTKRITANLNTQKPKNLQRNYVDGKIDNFDKRNLSEHNENVSPEKIREIQDRFAADYNKCLERALNDIRSSFEELQLSRDSEAESRQSTPVKETTRKIRNFNLSQSGEREMRICDTCSEPWANEKSKFCTECGERLQ